MPSTATTITITAAALAAGAGLSVAVPALAGIGGAHTPGARAAANVNADGTVVRSTGVTNVRKIHTGDYCIDLDPHINAATAVPVATARGGAPWDTIVLVTDNTGCGDASRTFRVLTGKTSGGYRDAQFHVVVD
ncbi:hypothetical protein NE236_03245 [Actinoallomurus purpureus]|uniref:hypothetical protein n=1 Tax=Actinoallomurus purpureus TaxID=478114 RepID=UPI002092FB5B|nr:hypothetical protein [Actinoallomurus purpureus]MCO6003986.1 hypothetical protein [Actinoallomurus purpureus]